MNTKKTCRYPGCGGSGTIIHRRNGRCVQYRCPKCNPAEPLPNPVLSDEIAKALFELVGVEAPRKADEIFPGHNRLYLEDEIPTK